MPVTYSHSENSETLVQLCHVLVEHDLCDEDLWNSSGKQPLRFAASSVKKAIKERCGDLLRRNVDYEFSIQDTVGSYGGEALREGELIFSVDCSGCGYLKIGPALALLETEEPGLGAAFYHLLRLSLYRWLRLYDHTDAEVYSDNLREWAEQEDEEARENMRSPTSKARCRLFFAARTSCGFRTIERSYGATAAAHGSRGSRACFGSRR